MIRVLSRPRSPLQVVLTTANEAAAAAQPYLSRPLPPLRSPPPPARPGAEGGAGCSQPAPRAGFASGGRHPAIPNPSRRPGCACAAAPRLPSGSEGVWKFKMAAAAEPEQRAPE